MWNFLYNKAVTDEIVKEVIEEITYMVPKAFALLERVETFAPPTKEKESIMESLKQYIRTTGACVMCYFFY